MDGPVWIDNNLLSAVQSQFEMLTLPAELYRLIFDSITGPQRSKQSTLFLLMLTCRAFHAEAERQLYREFVDNAVTRESLNTQKSFFRAVTRSPSKAALVRLYKLSYCPIQDTDPFWSLLREFLHVVPNLKELDFEIGSGATSASSLDGCTFLLEVFRCDNYQEEQDLLRFFAKQPAIRTLKLTGWRKSNVVPADILPNLNKLIGDHNAICIFVPGRRITHISWGRVMSVEEEHPMSHSLFQSLRHVQVLRCSPDLQLSAIADYLPNLITLQLLFKHVCDSSSSNHHNHNQPTLTICSPSVTSWTLFLGSCASRP